MKRYLTPTVLFVCALACIRPLSGQQKAKPAADTLEMKDGERLIGHVTRADGSSIVFKSDLVGEVTVKWSDVKELHSNQKLAVIPKGVKMRARQVAATAPQGTVSANAETISVRRDTGQTETVPVANMAHVVDATTFTHDVARSAGIFEDWNGTVTAGASLVEATQNSRNFTTGIALVRGIPPETWLEKQSRTELDFTSSYGTVTQPGTPALKTNIFHAGAQQDEYFSPSLFAFAQGMFDHNYSQGLNLQQTYSGGLGWTALSTSTTELDLKAGMSYESQEFATGPTQNLIGSIFSENYLRKFHRGWTLVEQLNVSPAWNNSSALLANGTVMFTMPLYKRFNFTTGVIDAFLNDPPPGFRKNSFQFTTGITYTLK
jgi:hypothetical protein